jgi:hypothetical protein
MSGALLAANDHAEIGNATSGNIGEPTPQCFVGFSLFLIAEGGRQLDLALVTDTGNASGGDVMISMDTAG